MQENYGNKKSKRTVKFFYRRKHAKKENRNDGLTSLLLPSFLGIMICAVCLAGGTFAWFTASQTTSTQVIKAANYSVITTVNDGTDNIDSENGIYSLEVGKTYSKTYKVTIEANGSATTGYCIIKLGNTEPYTEVHTAPISTGQNLTIELKINKDTTLQMIAQWGTSSKPEKEFISESYTYGDAKLTDTTNADEEIEQSPTEQTTENSPS